MAEQALSTTFVVGKGLPWPDDSVGSAERGPSELGKLSGAAGKSDCAIRKIAALGATVATDLAVKTGDALSVELTNGQRRNGKVEWARAGELGLAFDEPVDVVALINRNLVSQPAERRRMPRVELRCPVHVKWCEHMEPATTRNISAQGLQAEGDDLPDIGTLVSLFVEGINLPPAEVVWRQGRLAGFEFLDEVSWSSLIAWVREAGRK